MPKIHYPGTNIVAKQVKLLPTTLASHMGVGLCPAAPLPVYIPANSLEKATGDDPKGRPRGISWLLAQAWPGPGSCNHLSLSLSTFSLSPSFSPSLYVTLTFK